jgi:hypothetical protein
MDDLIILIVRGLIALFSRGEDKNKLPPPRSVPKIPPIGQTPQQMETGGQQITRRPDSQQVQKQQQIRQQQIRQQILRRQAEIKQLAARKQPQQKLTREQLEWLRQARRPGNTPPPIPIPSTAAPPVPQKRPVAAAQSVPQKAAPVQPTLSANAIRQLMLTRRSAMKTIYVLSEVVGPPIVLR